ncbi:hypothetical protein FFLO_04879 [Filobasidium floriforme]|uniref:NADPH-dependent FMN and FAD-containing oxidoreductase n=1 Tax=Filobasidium floriforme TaxID=5210 RepID=A0A8K0NNS8_9TREE|nr:hypothetical protein FFLO_04879 [Filobasidium floriforme]
MHADLAEHSDEDGLNPEKVLVLFASETGNAQDTAERVGREIRRRGGRCTVQSMEDFDISELPHVPLLILITSTHGRGHPPPAMIPLWTALLRSGLPDHILEDVNFALYGLGDSSYEKFCYAGKILARRMLSLGARLLGSDDEDGEDKPSSDAIVEEMRQMDVNGTAEDEEKQHDCLAWGDERAPDGLEETFLPWLARTMDIILPFLPPPSPAFVEYSRTDLPPPLYDIRFIDQEAESSTAQLEGEVDALEPGWEWATLKRNFRATGGNWWQDVREIDLTLESKTDYAPGSICSLRPETSAEEVDTFLKLNKLEDEADRPMIIDNLNHDQPLPRHLPRQTVTTLRRVLQRHLDLRAPPRKSFFEWLRRFSTEELEVDRLDEFIADPDEIHEYATRSRRSVLETMAEFRNTKIPLSHVLEVLAPLRRRQFSIASSSKAHPGEIQLLVALVDYKTNLKVRRRGLLSSWLRDLQLDSWVPLRIEPPTLFLPEARNTPAILVGPGTGVAPMRAFVEERIANGEAKETALYFGCRSKDQDMYFAQEMETWRKHGVHVRIACSRDQEEKIYVQTLIKEDAALIKDWIVRRNGNVYISGSSNAMPKAVRKAIAETIQDMQELGITCLEDAQRYVEDMFESGKRGGEESW